MSECECLPGCPFFNDKMKEKPAMSQIYKKRYCLGGENEKCARHMVKVAFGSANVPMDLYPNQIEKARELLVVGK